MNTKKVSILLVSVLFLFSCAVFDPITARHLEGTWYLNGERDKACEIVSTRDGLQARNETGATSQLEYDRSGSVRALDWGGIRGEIRDDRILWANGTTWTRVSR